MEITYVYQQSEPGLFTVGYYNPTGKWMPESDHDSSEAAAMRVHYLNGGKNDPTSRIADALESIASCIGGGHKGKSADFHVIVTAGDGWEHLKGGR